MKKGHYCKICGEYKANEKFSGKGHAQHICKDCAKLSPAQRSEMQTTTLIENLPFRLSKGQRSWLEKMRKNENEEIRNTAEWAWELRFVPMETDEEEEKMNYYEDMPGIMADLEVGCENLQMMTQQGEYERVNSYITVAIEHMKIALANLSDAEFHLTTGG